MRVYTFSSNWTRLLCTIPVDLAANHVAIDPRKRILGWVAVIERREGTRPPSDHFNATKVLSIICLRNWHDPGVACFIAYYFAVLVLVVHKREGRSRIEAFLDVKQKWIAPYAVLCQMDHTTEVRRMILMWLSWAPIVRLEEGMVCKPQRRCLEDQNRTCQCNVPHSTRHEFEVAV